jgi:hypothetical protein
MSTVNRGRGRLRKRSESPPDRVAPAVHTTSTHRPGRRFNTPAGAARDNDMMYCCVTCSADCGDDKRALSSRRQPVRGSKRCGRCYSYGQTPLGKLYPQVGGRRRHLTRPAGPPGSPPPRAIPGKIMGSDLLRSPGSHTRHTRPAAMPSDPAKERGRVAVAPETSRRGPVGATGPPDAAQAARRAQRRAPALATVRRRPPSIPTGAPSRRHRSSTGALTPAAEPAPSTTFDAVPRAPGAGVGGRRPGDGATARAKRPSARGEG